MKAARLLSNSTCTSREIYTILKKALFSSANRKDLQKLHSLLITFGLRKSLIFWGKLISKYSQFKEPNSCLLVFRENSQADNAYIWNTIIRAMTHNGLYSKALEFYVEMRKLEVKPDCYTFPSVINACGSLVDLERGRVVHEDVMELGFGYDLFINTALIDMYSRCNKLGRARAVFDGMPYRDIVSWSSLMSACGGIGEVEEGQIGHGLVEKVGTCTDVTVILRRYGSRMALNFSTILSRGGQHSLITGSSEKLSSILITVEKSLDLLISVFHIPCHLQILPKIEPWLSDMDLGGGADAASMSHQCIQESEGTHKLVFRCAQEQNIPRAGIYYSGLSNQPAAPDVVSSYVSKTGCGTDCGFDVEWLRIAPPAIFSFFRLLQYERLRGIAYGGFSEVHMYKDLRNGQTVAVKWIKIGDKDEGLPHEVLREISVLKELDHENIVRLLDVVAKEKSIYLVFEYLDLDLGKFITDHSTTGIDPLDKIMPMSCTAPFRAFFSRFLKKLRSYVKKPDIPFASPGVQIATLGYKAPEVLLGMRYSSAVDIWSVGCIFAKMVTRHGLFSGMSGPVLMSDILRDNTFYQTYGNGNSKSKSIQITYPSEPKMTLADLVPGLDEEGFDLLSRMLCMDPKEELLLMMR
ncbi:Pentatricopeptide repeat-containing protein [Sesamum angolense]|uniref:Pentatricopeptide repeat-containing protein n=1 Tax=Sesamum angolense TaxID=2727404 RepID=A0AAE2C6L9_9LAMI|nr:Pentatricopeptide repeat-containing protein [Sesamum angolense]